MIDLTDDRIPTSLNGRITAFINGKRMRYKFCSSNPLEEAKKEYPDLEYIGSSYIYYVNDVSNENRELTHYFRERKTATKPEKPEKQNHKRHYKYHK